MEQCIGILPNGTLPVVARLQNKCVECSRYSTRMLDRSFTYQVYNSRLLKDLVQT
jgi:hypothetical protein